MPAVVHVDSGSVLPMTIWSGWFHVDRNRRYMQSKSPAIRTSASFFALSPVNSERSDAGAKFRPSFSAASRKRVGVASTVRSAIFGILGATVPNVIIWE